MGGVELLVDQLGQTARVELGAIVAAGVVATLGALATARLIRSRATRPRRVFMIVAGAVLLLSLPGPLATAQTTGAAVGLVLLHLCVGLAVIPVVSARLAPKQTLR